MPGVRNPIPIPTFGGKQLWADVYLNAGYRIQEQVYSGQHRLLDPYDLRLAMGSYDDCRAVFDEVRSQREVKTGSNEAVLMLHGIFRAKDAFFPMARRLRREGWDAWSINYPSTRRSLPEHAETLERLMDHLEGYDRVHFVTHSMGGLLARLLLSRNGAWRQRIDVGRLVMIATPNQGANLANLLRSNPVVKLIGGPSFEHLTTDGVDDIPPPDVPFGIVAGVKGDGAGFNPLLEGEDDMTVALSETFLEGAEDELFVKAIHTFVMSHPRTVEGTVHYLRTGSFGDA